ncbi:MAG TPA: hypothetical protein PLS23_20355 [Phycisphaerae bacterium]|nr:hypothetical protein [Phycisphaerae bacterium]
MNDSQAVLTNEPESVPAELPPAQPSRVLDLTPVMILVTVGLVSGVILQRSRLMDSPNDSSRWNTVYYLVEHGTYEYLPIPREQVPWAIRGTKEGELPLWDTPVLWTIDMIRVDGKMYSSKPPLLPTVLAGVAWIAQKVTGQTFHENPWLIQRIILIVCQVLPFVAMLLIVRRHVFRATESVWVRHFAMAVACFGTLLTPWLITLNNHVIAAATGLIALDAAIRIWYEGRREWYWFTIAGFFAAFTASIELPAGLLAVILFVALLMKDHRRTLIAGLIPALIPACAALYTNYLVTGQLMPAYESWDKDGNQKGGFYDFPGSYWNNRKGIDAINEPKHVYLAHMLIGHDGFFSLSPILLVALGGILVQLFGRSDRRLLAAMTLGMTAVLVCVYLVKTNNYGGGCHGFRWLFWVIPMWLLFMPAGIELFYRRAVGRYVLYSLFLVSMFTVGYALDNPWSTNWLRALLKNAGVINY